MATVSAASFGGRTVAPRMSSASTFGSGLAVSVASAASLPLPVELGGARVSITDSAGTTRETPLFYVSTDQVNLQVPVGTALGAAQVVVSRSDSVVS